MISLSANQKRYLLIFLAISTLALAALIVSDWLPLLRGPAPESSEWYWPYSLRPFHRWWPSIIVAGLFWLVAAWWLAPEKSNRHHNLAGLAALVVASILLQLALIYADRANVAAELIDSTLSNQASGFFESAAEIEDMAAALIDYPQQMPKFESEHAQTHPPGLILANWLTIRSFSRWPAFSELIARSVRPLRCTDLWLLERPPEVAAGLAFWSLLPIVAAALLVLPAYGVARLLLQGRARRLAALLAAAVPALLLFSPKSVQLYALLSLTLFWVFQSAIKRKSLSRFLLAGILLSLMTYLSLGNAALLPLLYLYAVLVQWLVTERQTKDAATPTTWSHLLMQLLLFSAGAASLWLLTWLLWDVPPWAIAQVGLQQHYNLVTKLRRYDWWLIWNLIDWLIFSGWPMALGFLAALVLTAKIWRQKQLLAVDVLAFCLAALIILLNISGSARGEVGRIWLFLIPLLAYPAAYFWTTSLPGKRAASIIIALQLLMVVTLGVAWRPVRAVIVVAQEPPMPLISPSSELKGVYPGQPFSLIGYSLSSDQVQPGEQIELTLFWQADGPAQRPYTVFNHLTTEAGDLVAQQDNWPVGGRWPATCWQAGDHIVDTYLISIPTDLAAGFYGLHTGLYDSKSGLRVPTQDGADAFHLGSISIQKP